MKKYYTLSNRQTAAGYRLPALLYATEVQCEERKKKGREVGHFNIIRRL
jgi:hypothetical protein